MGKRRSRSNAGKPSAERKGRSEPRRVGIYLRISTQNGQTTENQRRELEQVAQRSGWEIVEVFEDVGVSGAKSREERPAFDDLLKAAARREIDLVAAWSVDRLGRSLQDLIGFLEEIRGFGCDLYLHQQAVDTTTLGGKALFQMMGVFAEFERGIIRERVMAGLARAREQGRIGGRPRVSGEVVKAVLKNLAKGRGILKTARNCKVGTSVVQRIKAEYSGDLRPS